MTHARKTMLAFAAFGALALGASHADAKGCLKGAAVGALAGHMAGHGVMGAAGGCAVGHHMANRTDRNATQQQTTNPSYNQGTSNYNQSRP